MLENYVTLPPKTTTMAHNDVIASVVWVKHISGMTLQVRDLYLFRVKEVKKTATAGVDEESAALVGNTLMIINPLDMGSCWKVGFVILLHFKDSAVLLYYSLFGFLTFYN